MTVSQCPECGQEVPDGAGACPVYGATPVQVRGFRSVVGWTLAGLCAGAILGPLFARPAIPTAAGANPLSMLGGVWVGGLLGLAAGTVVWWLFPYLKPSRRSPEDGRGGREPMDPDGKEVGDEPQARA